MASTRSTPRTQPSSPTDSPKQALAALARSAARTQIAASSAAVTSFAGWARATDQLAQAVGDELLRRIENETDSAELVAAVTKATSSHLRDLAALPRIASEHFDARLARVPSDTT